MRILILEDSVDRRNAFRQTLTNHQIFITDRVERAHKELRAAYEDGHAYDIVMLDNDLGEGLTEGHTLASHIAFDFAHEVGYTDYLQLVYIHSNNVVAADNMRQTLRRWVKVERIPFSSFPLEQLNLAGA